MAACTPAGHDVTITDENVEPVDFDEKVDLVGVSTMLLAQAPRAFAIADEYRRRGVPVVMGGLTPTCLPEEAAKHASLDQLGISPQCGFSSVAGSGQPITADDQKRKLELVLNVAREVWGVSAAT